MHAERAGYVGRFGRGRLRLSFASPQPLAELVGEVFQRLEIPFFLETGRSLGRWPAIVMLLAAAGVGCRRLADVQAAWGPGEQLLRPGLGRLERPRRRPGRAHDPQPANPPRPPTAAGAVGERGRGGAWERGAGAGSRERREAAMAGQPRVYELLRGLAEALDRLPRFDTLAAYALAWTQLADRVGILRSMQGDADQAAWKQLHETLRESQQLAAWLGQDVPRLDRKQAREALLDIVGSQTLGAANEEPGRVRVLSAASVRHLRIPYLFLAGLSEKSFPAADRDDGVYSEAEHQRLIEAGLPLPSRSDRQTDEMLLFYETITAATRRLYLSYPAVDESGEPLTPSPYLKEVEQACGGDADRARASRSISVPCRSQGDLCSIDAFRIRAVADAVQGKAELLAGLVGWDKQTGESVGSERGDRFARPTSPWRPVPPYAHRPVPPPRPGVLAGAAESRSLRRRRRHAEQSGGRAAGGRLSARADLQRHGAGTLCLLPLPVLPEQGAERPAAGRGRIGSRLHAAGTDGPRAAGGLSPPREPGRRRAGVAGRAGSGGLRAAAGRGRCRDPVPAGPRQPGRRPARDRPPHPAGVAAGLPPAAREVRCPMEGLRSAAASGVVRSLLRPAPAGRRRSARRPPSRWNW